MWKLFRSNKDKSLCRQHAVCTGNVSTLLLPDKARMRGYIRYESNESTWEFGRVGGQGESFHCHLILTKVLEKLKYSRRKAVVRIFNQTKSREISLRIFYV